LARKKTTIEVSFELRDTLKGMGRKGDSYEDIIWELVRVFRSRG
jgi:hypothetical protein